MGNPLTVENEIVTALRRIFRAVDLHSRHLEHAVGLTWPQLAVLRAAERLGACSIGAIAREVRLGQATLTGIIKRLERAGYVARSRDEGDGRSVIVTITAVGRKALKKAPSLLQGRFLAELEKLKNWERFQTLAALQRIAEMMDFESLDASPILVAGPVDAEAESASARESPIDSAKAASADPNRRRLRSKSESRVARIDDEWRRLTR